AQCVEPVRAEVAGHGLLVCRAVPELQPADEGRHRADTGADWAETWVFDVWLPDASAGAFTWLTLHPNERRAWYWSVLSRRGQPQLHVADVDAPLPATGLRVRTTGLWADHTCEAPFEQWTVQNECYAVALADPAEALGRAYGEATPIALDLEWYATAPPERMAGGYWQAGEGHAVVELAGGAIDLVGPAARSPTWGLWTPVPAAPLAGRPAYPRARPAVREPGPPRGRGAAATGTAAP